MQMLKNIGGFLVLTVALILTSVCIYNYIFKQYPFPDLANNSDHYMTAYQLDKNIRWHTFKRSDNNFQIEYFTVEGATADVADNDISPALFSINSYVYSVGGFTVFLDKNKGFTSALAYKEDDDKFSDNAVNLGRAKKITTVCNKFIKICYENSLFETLNSIWDRKPTSFSRYNHFKIDGKDAIAVKHGVPFVGDGINIAYAYIIVDKDRLLSMSYYNTPLTQKYLIQMVKSIKF